MQPRKDATTVKGKKARSSAALHAQALSVEQRRIRGLACAVLRAGVGLWAGAGEIDDTLVLRVPGQPDTDLGRMVSDDLLDPGKTGQARMPVAFSMSAEGALVRILQASIHKAILDHPRLGCSVIASDPSLTGPTSGEGDFCLFMAADESRKVIADLEMMEADTFSLSLIFSLPGDTPTPVSILPLCDLPAGATGQVIADAVDAFLKKAAS